jgi:hypothetical protein
MARPMAKSHELLTIGDGLKTHVRHESGRGLCEVEYLDGPHRDLNPDESFRAESRVRRAGMGKPTCKRCVGLLESQAGS